MKISKRSAWSKQVILNYLDEEKIPIRLACINDDGYPLVCSVWFMRDGDTLWAASHKNSHLVKCLKKNNRVGFEVATNDYPYKGVRGRADVELIEDTSVGVLRQLVTRYLDEGNKTLADWLLSRCEQEYAIRIVPGLVSSWDFSDRMATAR